MPVLASTLSSLSGILKHETLQMLDLMDKVALITGASSGIGRATAEIFAARGAKVVLAARREEELAALKRGIEARGGAASFVVTDVAIAKDVEAMVAHAIGKVGRLDCAVNNAGFEGLISSYYFT